MSQLASLLMRTPVLPVVTIERAADAVPLAQAMLRGGVNAIEITLRTAAAIQAIQNVAVQVPDMLVGAGTVLTSKDLQAVLDAGAKFAVSPGATASLLDGAQRLPLPLLPGVATASDLMHALDKGFEFVKFFPAATSGGIDALKAFAGPFSQVRFCPTGGVNLQNAAQYLALKNVVCVGGSWIAPGDAIHAHDWQRIEILCKTATSTLRGAVATSTHATLKR